MKLNRLIAEKEIIVVCGAGGVGKTTTSAALALAAARTGRRALVLTIDPARRLAQALGIPPTGNEPVQISAELLAERGVDIAQGGELHAWMLDPRVVLESVVDRFAPDDEAKVRIRSTRLYKALCEVMTGLQEYTAAEALYDFTERGAYDLIILDTPPSRNALDFLDAPRRLTRFLDERTLSLFAPDAFGKKSRSSTIVRAASKVVHTAISKAFGESFANELQQFLGAFGTLFGKMRIHAKGVRELLMSNRSAFVVITSPEELALDEALFFKRRIRELGLVAEGFILNRSYASVESTDRPAEIEPELRGNPHADVLRDALFKLDEMAAREASRAESDQRLFVVLDEEGKKHDGQGAIALPYLDEAVEDIPALAALSNHILEPRRAR